MPNRAVEIGRHFGGQRQFHQHRIGTSRNNPLVAPTRAELDHRWARHQVEARVALIDFQFVAKPFQVEGRTRPGHTEPQAAFGVHLPLAGCPAHEPDRQIVTFRLHDGDDLAALRRVHHTGLCVAEVTHRHRSGSILRGDLKCEFQVRGARDDMLTQDDVVRQDPVRGGRQPSNKMVARRGADTARIKHCAQPFPARDRLQLFGRPVIPVRRPSEGVNRQSNPGALFSRVHLAPVDVGTTGIEVTQRAGG